MNISTGQSAKHSSASCEHMTPPEVVELARAVMGGIDLDPASSRFANDRIVKATSFYDVEANGFVKPWNGRVFLNCPGGKCDSMGVPLTYVKGVGYLYPNGFSAKGQARSSTRLWWEKLISSWISGHVTEAVFIGFNMEILQSTQGHSFAVMDFPFCVPAKRMSFLKEVDGKLEVDPQPTHGNVIVYLPRRDAVTFKTKLFVKLFSKIGICKA